MIVFVHVPKTAGSTFQFILENSFGIRACHTNHTKKKIFDQDDFNFARKIFPGLRSISGHNLGDPFRLSVPDPYYITFLREPVARVISQYQDSVLLGGNKKSFEECLRADETLENAHVKMLAGERNLDKARTFLERCDFVGLTEKFDLSLRLLERLSPLKLNLNYKRRRVSAVNAIKNAILNDARILDQIRECNRLDLELYAFATDQIFPKLCAKAGVDSSEKVTSYDRYDSEIHFKFLVFSLYNMLFYRQLCKLRYKRQFQEGKIERM
ncbi:MAG: hypothetical protein C5B50_00170 [Verrucomicrobia bacterium]|nr:MAG: hypothetical protein C5B50_00170 [Verrucomicrobiota bacterium]